MPELRILHHEQISYFYTTVLLMAENRKHVSCNQDVAHIKLKIPLNQVYLIPDLFNAKMLAVLSK